MTMTLRRRATAVVSLAVVLAIAAFIHGRASGSPACTVTWTGASADQLWQTPGNWSPVHVPGPTDYACVPSASIDSITFTGSASVAGVSALGSKLVVNGALSLTDVAQASTIRNLRLTGNALSVAAGDTLTLAGHPVFAGGSIGGGGVVTMPAGANLAVIGASAVRNGTTLNLNGATAWSAGSFCLGEGSMINNAAAFTAAVNGAALADCAGPAINRFHNLAGGNLIRTGTAVPPLVFSTLFDNDGIVTTGPGALQIGANSAGASDTGSYVLGSGSALVLAGPRSFAASATITGAGLTQVVQDVTFAGQSVDHLLVQSGTVRGAFALPGDATWTGGVIDGPATATVSPTGTLAINGPLSLRNGRTLNNSGAVSWSAGAVCLGEASTLNNSGTLTLGADSVALADCAGAAGNRIHNLGAGTMLRIGTAGLDATITAPFDNDGTVHVGSGNLSLGAKTTGATDTGTYSTDAGSKLSLLPATPGRTFAASVTFGGAGLLSVNQSVAFAGQTLPHLALVGGTVKGPFVATGDFLWSTARLDGASTTTIANTATVTITKTVSIRAGKTVQNSGSIAWSGGSICVSGGSTSTMPVRSPRRPTVNRSMTVPSAPPAEFTTSPAPPSPVPVRPGSPSR